MANNTTRCSTCNKKKITYPCEGCSQKFCLMDLTEHRQILNNELHHIANEYDQFKQTINEQKQNPQNHSLIDQINQWEIKSIENIQQKAQEYREILIISPQICINSIKIKFNDLRKQIKKLQKENEFNEINLNYLRNELIKITKELNNPSNMSIQQNLQPFISDISIILSKRPKLTKWRQNAITVAGGTGLGQKLDQLNLPAGIFIDKNKNTLIADFYNHRIVEWKHNAKVGQVLAGGNGKGNRMNQLNHPTDVIVDPQNYSIIIADYRNRRVIQWLNQNQQILITDIDCARLTMDKNRFLYVSDYKKNEVKRWKMGEYDNEGIVVAGGNGQGSQSNQLGSPRGLSFDDEGNLYVADDWNHRIQKFEIVL
ncbi:unnamed protein product [Adineta steineri]|uniref:Uncharacterized protein n=1 Tax=Adineta steineri TaxID=433720 RepID=A0A819ZM63_9BILA|nr:unnamed protein product [Adineta steineri]CAF4170474.1 unnamed protein product [Adineta steineri]